MVLNWVNFCFKNLVWGIHRTVTKLYSGSKKLHSTVLGIFTQFGESCLWLVESKDSSPVDEEEIKVKMDDGVNTSLASEGTDHYLWELSLGPWNKWIIVRRTVRIMFGERAVRPIKNGLLGEAQSCRTTIRNEVSLLPWETNPVRDLASAATGV